MRTGATEWALRQSTRSEYRRAADGSRDHRGGGQDGSVASPALGVRSFLGLVRLLLDGAGHVVDMCPNALGPCAHLRARLFLFYAVALHELAYEVVEPTGVKVRLYVAVWPAATDCVMVASERVNVNRELNAAAAM